MNKYHIKQISQTFSSVVSLAIIFTSSCQFLACSDEAVPAMTNYSPSTNYDRLDTNSSSFSPTCELRNNIRNESYPVVAKNEVGNILTNLFMDLSATQEPLGTEFEKVLFENIWELYQS